MPKNAFVNAFSAAALAVSTLCVSANACAELGGMVSAFGQAATGPRTLLNGELSMRTSTDAGSTTINEYATGAGEIVAYTWQGPTMPDLFALLGKYASSYRNGAAAAAADGNLHASRVATPDVIVESGGAMRGYIGRAWLPNALPPGVTADDLR